MSDVEGEDERRFTGANGSLWATLILAASVFAWLWPIGLGGQMPVGGDVTQFFMGLMGFLSQSLKAGRLPVWNDLWGYGFAGIGESQMGVYYPPHLLLYGVLPTELAYVASLLLHTLCGAIGAWWAARRFGVSQTGAVLSGFCYAASGFSLIHMPHPWGYTSGAWMPWAWGLGRLILEPGTTRRSGLAFLLTLVLFVQLLIGHFQIAFMTVVTLGLMAVWGGFLEGFFRRRDWEGEDEREGENVAGCWRLGVILIACVAIAFPLASLQLVPTARLARLASSQRDFQYLSEFAATPFHLVSLVAPGLFHQSSQWRPLVWDPFHTSPEEMLIYVGIVPLFLAVMAVYRTIRRDRATRLLTVLAVGCLLLSLGPYLPGFRQLIAIPGFSFFRAPARWTLPVSLAIAMLAGKGWDGLVTWPRTGRSLVVLAGISFAWIAMTIGLIELALASGSPRSGSWAAPLYQQAFQLRPWADGRDFVAVMAEARKPGAATKLPPGLERAGGNARSLDTRSFQERRWEIYRAEIWKSLGLLGAVLGVGLIAWLAPAGRSRRLLPYVLMVLSFVDLWSFASIRPISLGPIRPLVEQSPVLKRMAAEPRGTRVVDGFRNMPMLVGLEPISAYRTLDLPALEPLQAMARGPLTGTEATTRMVDSAMRAAGVGLRVLDPFEVAAYRLPDSANTETFDDPALAGWVFGPDWLAEQGAWASRFQVVRPRLEPSRAWFLPLTAITQPAMLDSWTGDVPELLKLFDRTRPLPLESSHSGQVDITVDADESGWVIISQLADPEWTARWASPGSDDVEISAEILPTFRRRSADGGWQRIKVDGGTRQRLRLTYQGNDVRAGLWITAISWVIWGTGLIGFRRWERRRRLA